MEVCEDTLGIRTGRNKHWGGGISLSMLQKVHKKKNSKGRDLRFILPHGFKGFSPWSSSSIALGLR
jgi:hypothetical protein